MDGLKNTEIHELNFRRKYSKVEKENLTLTLGERPEVIKVYRRI